MLLVGCSAASTVEPEAWAVDGRALHAPALAPEVAQARAADLEAAEAELRARPDDPDALIWVGRRLAYLGRFRDAVATFTRGVEQFPADARFLRHRGHRWITLRRFDAAISDLETAARTMLATPDVVEPDGQPNARNIPTGTLYFNVYYHLALAHYLAGQFARSAEVWARCQEVSRSPDKLVATSFWHYLTLRRLGRHEEAQALLTPIAADLDVIENHAYHALLRAFASGDVAALSARVDGTDRATIGNGVAAWRLVQDDVAGACAGWAQIVAATPWPAFGHIAAEVELQRTCGGAARQ